MNVIDTNVKIEKLLSEIKKIKTKKDIDNFFEKYNLSNDNYFLLQVKNSNRKQKFSLEHCILLSANSFFLKEYSKNKDNRFLTYNDNSLFHFTSVQNKKKSDLLINNYLFGSLNKIINGGKVNLTIDFLKTLKDTFPDHIENKSIVDHILIYFKDKVIKEKELNETSEFIIPLLEDSIVKTLIIHENPHYKDINNISFFNKKSFENIENIYPGFYRQERFKNDNNMFILRSPLEWGIIDVYFSKYDSKDIFNFIENNLVTANLRFTGDILKFNKNSLNNNDCDKITYFHDKFDFPEYQEKEKIILQTTLISNNECHKIIDLFKGYGYIEKEEHVDNIIEGFGALKKGKDNFNFQYYIDSFGITYEDVKDKMPKIIRSFMTSLNTESFNHFIQSPLFENTPDNIKKIKIELEKKINRNSTISSKLSNFTCEVFTFILKNSKDLELETFIKNIDDLTLKQQLEKILLKHSFFQNNNITKDNTGRKRL